MREEILKVIEDMGPKHFSRRIKNTPGLWQWVLERTTFLEDDVSISERIHVALSGDNPICEEGNRKKFKNIDYGYGFCATTGKCRCAQRSVSESVSKTVGEFTNEQKADIQQKREQTSLEKYGVTNNAQTEEARQRHKDFYGDPEKVRKQVEKQQKTMRENHGVDNARDIPGVQDKIEITNLMRLHVSNPLQSDKVQETRRQRSLEKWGYESPTQHPSVRAKLSRAKRIVDNQDAYIVYCDQVNRWTRDVKKTYLDEGYTFGTKNDDYQLDHIIPKVQGYTQNIPPWILGCKWNIQLTTGRENKSKGGTFQPQSVVDMIVDRYFSEES